MIAECPSGALSGRDDGHARVCDEIDVITSRSGLW
jgi:hypothetical protein